MVKKKIINRFRNLKHLFCNEQSEPTNLIFTNFCEPSARQHLAICATHVSIPINDRKPSNLINWSFCRLGLKIKEMTLSTRGGKKIGQLE